MAERSYFVLGVTGAIGAGKSTVSQVLAAHGWSVLDVDDVAAAALVAVLPEVAAKVPAVVSATGALNKTALFAAMLRDAALRQELELLLRPLVFARLRHTVENLRGPLVLDAALLFESGLEVFCTATLGVQCARDERRRRVRARSTASAQHFDAIEAAQWSESAKLVRAGAVIAAEGSHALLEEKIFAALGTLGFLRKKAEE